MIDDSSPYSLKQEFYCFPIGSVKGEGKIQRRSFDILHNLRVQRVLLRFRILHNKVINLHGKAFHAIGTDSLQSARFCVELTHLWIRLIRDLVFTRQQHYCKRNNSHFFHIFIVLVWNRNLSPVSNVLIIFYLIISIMESAISLASSIVLYLLNDIRIVPFA